jgi:transposase InsO family protein
LKLGFELSQGTVAKYMVRRRKPPSQTWHTFLQNHVKDLVATDFFVVPTVFFKLLFVFVILSHDRRHVIHFAATAYPTSEWGARQLWEAFPWNSAPRYLLRDRDGSYGASFCEAANSLGIREVLSAPQSPWQNAYVERLIGSIRRECLDHVMATEIEISCVTVFSFRANRRGRRSPRSPVCPPRSRQLPSRRFPPLRPRQAAPVDLKWSP